MNKIFRNSLFSIIRTIVVTPIIFLVIPYTLSKIGTKGYGIWALTGMMANFRTFVDFGFTTSLIRFVAKEEAAKRVDGINEYVNTALFIFAGLSLVILIIVLFSAHFIASDIFNITGDLPLVEFLIIITTVSSILNFICGIFKSILDGYQRMDISNSILSLESILNAVGTFFFLFIGLGIQGLAVNLLIMAVVNLFINFFAAKKIFPLLSIRVKFFSRAKFKELFLYSVNLQLSNLLRFWVEPLNKILISHFFSLTYVGYYEIALRYVNQIKSLIVSGMSSLFPAAAEFKEKHGFGMVEKLRNKSLKYIIPLSLLVYSFLIIITPGFMSLWLKIENPLLSATAQVFLFGHFVLIITTPPYVILNSLGYPQKTLYVQVLSLIANVLGIASGVFFFGFIGFSCGYTFSLVAGLFLTQLFYKTTFKEANHLYREYIKINIILYTIVLASAGVIFNLLHIKPSVWEIIIFGAVFVIVGAVSSLALRLFDKNDLYTLFGSSKSEKILGIFGVK